MQEVPSDEQRQFWNEWNKLRETELGAVSLDQAETIESWLAGRKDLDILDVGCGSGWLCERLLRFGSVTGTDLADAVVKRAAMRVPGAVFVPGDFMSLEFDRKFDVVTSVEVLSHVEDQAAFIAKLASLLEPGGELLLATQNRFVLERNDVPPPGQGQLRRWVDRRALLELLAPHFTVANITTRTPMGHLRSLRFVNSVKLTALTSAIFGAKRVRRAKERLGFGWSILVRAIRRGSN